MASRICAATLLTFSGKSSKVTASIRAPSSNSFCKISILLANRPFLISSIVRLESSCKAFISKIFAALSSSFNGVGSYALVKKSFTS